MWNRILEIFGIDGGDRAGMLFGLAVCLFFVMLPVHTDSTVTIIVMTLLGIWAAKGRGIFNDILRGSGRVAVWGFLFFLAVCTVTSIVNFTTMPRYARFLLWGCCAFSGLLLSRCLSRHGSRYFWALFFGIAGSFLAAVLFVGWDSGSIWHDGRLKLFAIHPSRLALYCVVCFFFFMYRAAVGGKAERVVCLAAMLFTFFILFKTNTRGNLLMLPVGALCLASALPPRFWAGLLAAMLLCVLLGGGILWLDKSSFTGKRLIGAITDTTEDHTWKTRLPIWETGWESFRDAPLIGHGPQSFLELHRKYLQEHKAEWDVRYKGNYEPRVKQAHNVILGRLVETGFLGTAGFLIFYFGAIAAAWRGPVEYRWLLAPLVFYMGMNMLDDGLFRMNDSFIFFVAGTALGFAPVRRFLPWRR